MFRSGSTSATKTVQNLHLCFLFQTDIIFEKASEGSTFLEQQCAGALAGETGGELRVGGGGSRAAFVPAVRGLTGPRPCLVREKSALVFKRARLLEQLGQ